MHNFHEIIEQIKRQLHCPVCGQHYHMNDIHFKGLFDQALIVQTVCTNGHLALFITNIKNSQTFNENRKSITTNEVLDFHNALKKFDGDFEKKWQK